MAWPFNHRQIDCGLTDHPMVNRSALHLIVGLLCNGHISFGHTLFGHLRKQRLEMPDHPIHKPSEGRSRDKPQVRGHRDIGQRAQGVVRWEGLLVVNVEGCSCRPAPCLQCPDEILLYKGKLVIESRDTT